MASLKEESKQPASDDASWRQRILDKLSPDPEALRKALSEERKKAGRNTDPSFEDTFITHTRGIEQLRIDLSSNDWGKKLESMETFKRKYSGYYLDIALSDKDFLATFHTKALLERYIGNNRVFFERFPKDEIHMRQRFVTLTQSEAKVEAPNPDESGIPKKHM